MLETLKRWLLPASPALPEAAMPGLAARSEVQRASRSLESSVVIDVRSEREFHAAAVEHAVNLPLPQLAQRISEFAVDKATPLVLYCASGARSGIACGVLEQLGYTNVTNAGGLYAAAESLQREVRR
jgi:phage shock protein E